MEGKERKEDSQPRRRRRQAMVLVLLVVAAVGLWSWMAVSTPTAFAGRRYPEKGGRPILPDSGAQRQAIVNELKSVNAKLDQLHKALTSGKLKVIAIPADDKGGVPVHAQPKK